MIRTSQDSKPISHLYASPLDPIPMGQNFSSVPIADSFEQSSESLSKQMEESGKKIQEDLESELKTPDTPLQEKLSKINARLHSQGKPPIDYGHIIQDLEDIENSGSDSKEKKEKIDQLRKSLGLSKKEMKRLFTQRMARLYRESGKRLDNFQASKLSPLKTALTNAEKVFGAQSPQAKDLKDRLQSLEQNLDSQAKENKDKGKFFGSLYPGFWARLGSFFKKVGLGLLHGLSFIKSWVRFIPGIGTIASLAISGVEKLVDLIRRPKPSPFLN